MEKLKTESTALVNFPSKCDGDQATTEAPKISHNFLVTLVFFPSVNNLSSEKLQTVTDLLQLMIGSMFFLPNRVHGQLIIQEP